MKALLMLIVVVVVAGGAWFYLRGIDTGVVAPKAVAFDQLGVGKPDPTMEMKPIDGAAKTEATPAPTKEAPAPSIVAVNEKTVSITAANFAFSTKEIRVKKGDKVTINFASTGGMHDWVVDEFNARTKQVRPGTKTSTTFTAGKTGTFEFYCSVDGHRSMGMVGKLVVE